MGTEVHADARVRAGGDLRPPAARRAEGIQEGTKQLIIYGRRTVFARGPR
jgi:hypothetical protein